MFYDSKDHENIIFSDYITEKGLIDFNLIFEKTFGYILTNKSIVYGIYSNDILVYIGTTKDLRSRFKRHFKNNNKLGAFLRLKLTLNQNLELKTLHNISSYKVESDFIKLIKPKFNGPFFQY